MEPPGAVGTRPIKDRGGALTQMLQVSEDKVELGGRLLHDRGVVRAAGELHMLGPRAARSPLPSLREAGDAEASSKSRGVYLGATPRMVTKMGQQSRVLKQQGCCIRALRVVEISSGGFDPPGGRNLPLAGWNLKTIEF